ncbi:putative helicase mov-10-B.1 [Cololabis saira]|uniref:putative helicase mov-10-B.1 n=1 Tax=Cololabis saira TaxID=129043 RepID=UPI002AD3D171|nr:putative helicase mov-10-B.1 [Cololabis saira]
MADEETSSSDDPTSDQIREKTLPSDILRLMEVNREGMTADKKGVKITSEPLPISGKVQLNTTDPRKTSIITFHIVNEGSNSIYFTYYTALTKIYCFTLEDEKHVKRRHPLTLGPGERYDVVVKCKLDNCELFFGTMCFEFQLDLTKKKCFYIVREMEVKGQTLLGPETPYKPFKARMEPVSTRVENRIQPDFVLHVLLAEVKLFENKCPMFLKELVKKRFKNSTHLSSISRNKLPSVKFVLSSALDMHNYSHRFHRLLHLEEIQMEKDIRRFDLQNQTLTPDPGNTNLFILKVPAENRPPVLKGDRLKVTRSEDKSSPVYTGYVHERELDQVKLQFRDNPELEFSKVFSSEIKFDVEFTINRWTLKLQHRAVDLAKQYFANVLFPSCAAEANAPLPELRFFNPDLNNNPEQCLAVQHIVAGSSKPAPYILFGPPGTGKTVTLVEAISQIRQADASAHILVCAPINSACDLLCERLVSVNSDQVYHMCAQSRDPRTVPENIRKYCSLDKDQLCFTFPSKETLMKYRIIVTTLYTAGRLVNIGAVGHFSHVFVDEAGRASEPECVIAVAGLLCAVKGHLVLAGDPKQLGPIIKSLYAKQYGLGLSLLERLMGHNTSYHGSDKRFVTKLLQNYRSHDAILKIPNEEFYNSELKAFAKSEREAYCGWDHLPTKNFPVIFHGVIGKGEKEGNGKSYFNEAEIEVLVQYLTKLVNTQGQKGLPKLSGKDIGIIALYRKQVEKIQKALNIDPDLRKLRDLKEVKVGCVEEFQGLERNIILISTVRSSHFQVHADKISHLGFLACKKRFNVAVTRAKSLLIVVGNPLILKTEPIWKKFIDYCVDMKGYTGFDLDNDMFLLRISA